MSEKKEAKRLGARQIKNSGRGMFKSDIKKGNLIIDLKEVSKSFTLNEKVWAKVCSDAMSYGSEFVPIILVKFDSGVRLAITAEEDSIINERPD